MRNVKERNAHIGQFLVYATKPDRLTCNVTLSQRMDDLTGLLLWGGSRLTCSKDKLNTFKFQQATIFTAILLFQLQIITIMYIKIQNYCTYIFCLLFYTLAHRHYFVHDIVMRCKKSSDAPMTAKDNAFLTIVYVQSKQSCRRVFVWQWQQVCDKTSNLRLYYVNSGTQHHNKRIF